MNHSIKLFFGILLCIDSNSYANPFNRKRTKATQELVKITKPLPKKTDEKEFESDISNIRTGIIISEITMFIRSNL